MNLGSVLVMPVRVGLTAAEAALSVAETVVGTVRVAASPTTYSALGAVGLPDTRSSVGLLQQISKLTSEDRGLGHALRPGGPLDRLLAPGGPVDRLTEPGGLLDRLLEGYVEEGLSRRDLIAAGFAEAVVKDVCRKVDLNEYKRKQAAPGLKITPLAFGVGRRIPIVQKYVS